MSNNDNFFSIWNHIDSNLRQNIQEEKVIVSMSEDSVGEPFIEIIYVNKQGEEISLIRNLNNVESIIEFAENISSAFKYIVFSHNEIPIKYSMITKKLHILNDETCTHLRENSSIFTCFVINKSANFSRPTKIFKLLSIIDCIMYSSTGFLYADLRRNVVFKVNNKELKNVYFRGEDYHYEGLSINNAYAKENLEIINKEYGLNFTETPFQKVKK